MKIIGHQKIIQFLQKSIDNHKLAHAYLFYGPEHIGKTTVAENFITRLLCLKGKSCGRCLGCKQALKHIHPDLNWISDSPIGIDSIREVIKFVSLKPLVAPYRVVIIEQADTLTIQAANAFLKLLEEAPAKSIIILITKNLHYLPATLRSRCQILRFSLPPKEELVKFFKSQFNLKQEEIKKLLFLSLSRPGLAIKLIQDPEAMDKYQQVIDKFINVLSVDNFEDKLNLTGFILDSASDNLNHLLVVIRMLILAKFDDQSIDGKFNQVFQNLVKKYDQEKLVEMAYQVLNTQFLLRYNVNQRLAIENLLINI